MKGRSYVVCASDAKRRQIRNEMQDMCAILEPNAHVLQTVAAPMELCERDVMGLLGTGGGGNDGCAAPVLRVPSRKKHQRLAAYVSSTAHKPNVTATEMARTLGFECPRNDYLRGAVVFVLAPTETDSESQILGRPIPADLIRGCMVI
jgi:hypothetical protein